MEIKSHNEIIINCMKITSLSSESLCRKNNRENHKINHERPSSDIIDWKVNTKYTDFYFVVDSRFHTKIIKHTIIILKPYGVVRSKV